ncbi:aspartyl-phosphate phosphatase Spo0E family protein [Paenibacillus aceris]|uniref:Aspartyl-phosphate phosphatase Spo0E family protein n=1 Tax=Paenibacillus aceris TaxID=869555 RepID=A0ABS4HXM7_9BACL|nr:aspartyl-phosphate phosphatase Spo0E family protein [Paenibacillus aceris]MBP1962961.1 hypothetical protein [Paenibacillus aceris]NHW38387.1 aspartyl-phosphate phosphatase Spo0E family protein [Paenibacillus aceris]
MGMKKQLLLEEIERLRHKLLRDPMKNNFDFQENQIYQLSRRLDDLLVQFIREEVPENLFKVISCDGVPSASDMIN